MADTPDRQGRSQYLAREEVQLRVANEQERIGACLRAHRQERGWSREQAARQIGIHPVHLAKIELGTANCTLATLTAVAAAYGLSLKHFFQSPPPECECA